MGTRSEELKSDIEHTRSELTQDVDRITGKTSPRRAVKRRADGIRLRARNLSERVMGTTNRTQSGMQHHAADATGAVKQNAAQAVDAVKAAPDAAMRKTQGNPMAAGLIAFAAGALAASLIPETMAERRAARQVREQAGDYIEPVVESLKESAASLGDEAKSTAQDAAQQVKESASNAAQTTKEQASQVRHQR